MLDDGVVHVIEDDLAMRDALLLLLETAGFPARGYGSAEDFLEKEGLGKRACLLVDVRLPGMDGLTVIREAKRYKSDLPVIIITGFSTESSAIEAVNLGVAGYLTKPFRVPQVLAAAAKALGDS